MNRIKSSLLSALMASTAGTAYAGKAPGVAGEMAAAAAQTRGWS